MEKAVKAPPEFVQLAQVFQSVSPKEVEDEHAWIAAALQHLNARSKRVVKQFLTDLLSQNPDEEELQELWKSTDGGYYIAGKHGNNGVRHVLTLISDEID